MNFPEIEAPAAPAVASEVVEPAQLPALVTLRNQALQDLTAVERGIAKLRAEHGSTDYDITTPHGYRLATTRRHAVRLVRYEVPKVVKAKKAELAEIRDAVQTEGDRITSLLLAIENPHDEKIKAEDERRAEEKRKRDEAEALARAEAARIEAERVAKHRQGIDLIRAYLTHARAGLTAERIARGIQALEVVPIGGFEEFTAEAEAAKAETLQAMRDLHAATLAAEQEAARVEAQQRLENERIALELAEEDAAVRRIYSLSRAAAGETSAQVLAAVTEFAAQAQQWEGDARPRVVEAMAEARRVLAAAMTEAQERERIVAEQRAEAERLAAERAQIEAERAQMAAERAKLDAIQPAKEDDQPKNAQEGSMPGTPGPCASSAPEAAAAPSGDEGTVAPAEVCAAEPAPIEAPSMRLSDMSDRLGFIVGEKLLQRLGFEATPVKTAHLYYPAQFPAICDALVNHITNLKD